MLSEQAREQWLQTSVKWNDMVQQRLQAGTQSAITVMDRVAVAATSGIDAATQRWMGWTIGRQTRRDYGIPRGLPYLTGFVVHAALVAEGIEA